MRIVSMTVIVVVLLVGLGGLVVCEGGHGRGSGHHRGRGHGYGRYRSSSGGGTSRSIFDNGRPNSPCWLRPGKEIGSTPARYSWGVHVEPPSKEVVEARKKRDEAFRAAFAEWKKANEDLALGVEISKEFD
jgi:hypothetical protein